MDVITLATPWGNTKKMNIKCSVLSNGSKTVAFYEATVAFVYVLVQFHWSEAIKV